MHMSNQANSSDMNLIPTGWRLVKDGPAYAGDKYWDPALKSWLPITVNLLRQVGQFVAVIRKGER
jgi:hypothetical protein